MIIRRTIFHLTAILAAICSITPDAFAQCSPNTSIPGKFYEWYIVAVTGCNGLTALGQGPSINDFGEVAFMGQTSAGQTIWTGTGSAAPTNINPGSAGSSEFFDAALWYNNKNQIATKDSITTTSPATTSIRVWNAASQNSYRYVARGGPQKTYSAVFPFPAINNEGGVAAMGLSGTQQYLLQQAQGSSLVEFPVKVSVGEPVIDDNGDVLLYQETTVPSTGFQLMLYQSNLSKFTVIADYNLFTSIDYVPGISSDGMVIAFQGNLSSSGATTLGTTPGPGIFAATNQGSGVWQITRVTGIQAEVLNTGGNNDGICNPGETCVPGAELGYDESGNAIYFNLTGYPTGSRVGVTNLGLGASGIQDDSFVISFVGTPTEASRPNPVIPTFPLFFSANQGLWTIRVDVQNQLDPPNSLVVHPATAIPVVQIGDKIFGQVVTGIGINDQIGNAAKDETGTYRTMRRGDHRVAFWVSTESGAQMIVRGNHLDSDQDGLLDHWETTGIDMDQDGIVDLDLPAMGANPNVRDLFIEMDWISDQGLSFGYNFQPVPGVISPLNGWSVSPLVSMFNLAPSLSGSEYGALYNGGTPATIPAGITLHIDGGSGDDVQGHPLSLNMVLGPLNGGNQIGLTGTSSAGLPEVIYFGKPNSLTIPGVNTRAYQDVKDNFFGSLDKDGRELAFHYVVLGDYFTADADSSGAMSWKVASAGVNWLDSASPLPAANQGDVVKITAGTGAGGYGTIQGFNEGNEIVLYNEWVVVPDDTSQFSVLAGNMGRAEVFINPNPDYNSLPGNDLILSFGELAVEPNTAYDMFKTPSGEYLLGTQCQFWRVLAHELGHTLGLRHGGTDNNAYKGSNYQSLMSYSWQNVCDGAVYSYSGTGDPTFDDWANLQGDFSNAMIHLGNTVGAAYGTDPETNQFTPELNFIDYVNQNGPPVTTPPTVSVQSPKANANEGLGSPMAVTVDATDSVTIASVSVSFDVNGNGVIDPGELITAKPSGTNTYKANFPALSGPVGTRTITAAAADSFGNSATAAISVHVQEPNPVPSLISLSPSSTTHGGASFTLTINGSNFVSGCTADWNGAALATTFVSSSKVTAKVTAADIASAGTANVTVKNPAPGGGTSNALVFTID
jgi:Big-like domain-containing protein